jgi:hypothetical protein
LKLEQMETSVTGMSRICYLIVTGTFAPVPLY